MTHAIHDDLAELAPGVFWMAPDDRTDRPVLAAVAGKEATLMVDAGNSVKHALAFLDALAATKCPPVRYVVLTHSHWDHVFGTPAIDATVIATTETARRVATMATWRWDDASLDERVATGLEIAFCRDMIKAELTPAERDELAVRVPDETFETERTIDLGGREVHIRHVGGDHAGDSCIVVVPGVAAFLSDCMYPNLHVEPNEYTQERLFPLLDRLLALDVAWYVLGHDPIALSRASFAVRAGALKTIGEAVSAGGDHVRARLSAAGFDTDTPDLIPVVDAFRAGEVRAHERTLDGDRRDTGYMIAVSAGRRRRRSL